MKIDFKKLAISIVGSLMTGVVGSFFTSSSISTWYSTLDKPSFNPPNWVFAPVWTTLFILMGFAAYLVWNKRSVFQERKKKQALQIFVLQLGFNISWSILFFGFKSPVMAFFEITVLWLSILVTIFQFKKFSRLAAWLLVPYLLWVSFAGVLNFAIWALN